MRRCGGPLPNCSKCQSLWSEPPEETNNPLRADERNFCNGQINCRQKFSMRLKKR